jgi:diacylglycerol kinase family enzyme
MPAWFMNLQDFALVLADLCAHSPVVPGRPLRWTVIANPRAGGFAIRSRWKKNRAILDAYAKKTASLPLRKDCGPSLTARELNGESPLGTCGLIPTAGPGHAGKIAGALIDEMRAAMVSGGGRGQAAPFYLIITAGGDGTSLEMLGSLFFAPAAVRSNCAVLRLPMGTGNDGADAAALDQALDLLISPSRIEWTGAVRLRTATAGKGPFLAFNILSLGLDAFVTHMTNKMKKQLPGDSYKLWVDMAALFYDKIYRVGPMELRVFDGEGREQTAFRETVLLLAVGESGRRTYGSQKKILPDDRNVCVIRQMPLLRKLALKDLFNTGSHVDKPEARLFTAGRVEFRGEHPILAQMDGETVLLQPGDFPGQIELTEKLIPVLRLPPRG